MEDHEKLSGGHGKTLNSERMAAARSAGMSGLAGPGDLAGPDRPMEADRLTRAGGSMGVGRPRRKGSVGGGETVSAAPNLSGAGAAKVPGAFAGAGRKKLPDLLGWLAALLAVLALFLLPAAALCGWWWPDSCLWASSPAVTLPGYEDTVWGETDDAGRAVPTQPAEPGGQAAESGVGAALLPEAGQAEAAGAARVYIGGDRIEFSDAPPLISRGRVMVPMRQVFESNYVQCRVLWLSESRQAAVFDQKGRCLLFTAGAGEYQILQKDVPAESRPLDAPAMISQGRIYLPLRALLETFSYKVEWNERSRRVDIQDGYPAWRKLLPPEEWAKELKIWEEQLKEGCLPCYIKPYLR